MRSNPWLVFVTCGVVASGCRPDLSDGAAFGSLLDGGRSGPGGGPSGGGAATGSGGGTGGGSVPAKVYPGVVPTGVQPGGYWDIATYTESFGKTYSMGYRLTLGRALELDGVEGFEVTTTLLWWYASDGVGDPQLPPIRYLSFTDGVIKKRSSSGPWQTVFSEYGAFRGVYFFQMGDQNEAVRDVESDSMRTTLRNASGVPTVSQVLSNSTCTYYPQLGQTLCSGGGTSGGSETAVGRGYFEYGEGFIGHWQRNCITQGCTLEEAAVLRWSPTGPAPACSGDACCRALGGNACPPPYCSDPAYPVECPATSTFSRGCWAAGVNCASRTRCGSTISACSSTGTVPDCSTQTCVATSACATVPAGTCGACAQTHCCARVAEWNRTHFCDAARALDDCLQTSCGCQYPPDECAIP